MNLNFIAGVLTGFITVCLFTLHIVSARHWVNWPTLPEYLRRGLIVAGFLMMIRSVNFFTFVGHPAAPGNANEWVVLTSLGMAYAMGALVYWSITEYLPAQVRQRLDWVRVMLKTRPDLAPVLLTPDEVADVAHADGAAAIKSGEPPEAAYREAPRLIAAYERRARRAGGR